ncbi:MAG: SDR family NAD(P)-dependent oxidoreductase [Candidatus Eremiobacteraeota bacterium]|nr:SDR family NAD(P)-dependent oxidoreductase [Candidatus Eremiobacteraeota bacterium]
MPKGNSAAAAPRTMIVTGASSGIGEALTRAAAARGYRVVAVARRVERLEALRASITDGGGRCITVAADVTAPESAARIVDAALRDFGRIDVVVNNAGGGTTGALLEQSDAQLDAQWRLNVVAPLRLARAALASLEPVRGVLVFVGSGSARIPLPQWGAYASAKAAIRAAAIQLRRELRPRGIAVTYVDPGLVATEFHSAMGIRRPNGIVPTAPDRVARAILRGIERRRAVVNATPLQSLGTLLGEFAGTLADPLIRARFAPRPVATAYEEPIPPCHPELVEGRHSHTPSMEAALEPLARRMERVKLPQSFLREALVADQTLEFNALAMRWAGMPNKNERAALREALDALAAAGYLQPLEDEKWQVLRSAQ